MKVDDAVKAYVKEKWIPGIVIEVEDRKGFRNQWPYQKVWVEFEDESVLEFCDFNLIAVLPKEKVEAVPETTTKKGKKGK